MPAQIITATADNGPISILSLIRPAGESPDIRPTPGTHPVGSIVIMSYQYNLTPWVVVGYREADRLNRQAAMVVKLESPTAIQCIDLIHPHGTRRGIGWYQPADQSQAVTAEEAARLLALASGAQEAARQAEADRIAEGQRQEAAGHLMLALLGDAPAVLVADLREDQSDSQTDYHGHRTVRRVIVGKLTSDRVSFKAWKAACAAHPDPAIQALATGTEHRENWSMGGGYFLTAAGGHRDAGWCARSERKPAGGWSKAWDVCRMLAAGDHPWQSAKVLPAAEVIAAAEPAPAAEEPAAPVLIAAPEVPGAFPGWEHARNVATGEVVQVAAGSVPAAQPAPVAAGPLIWRPVMGEQTRQLRAHGLDVAALKAAGFAWKRDPLPGGGMPFAWVCDPATPEAAAILATLTGQDPTPPQGPGGGKPTDKPEAKQPATPASATPAPAGTALERACADAGILARDNGIPAMHRAADQAVMAAHTLAAPTGGQPGLPALQGRIVGAMERAQATHGKADARLARLVDKAQALADRLDKEAEAGERDRNQNTPKRLAQAMHARLDASRARRGATLLREWAADPGRLPGWAPNKEEAVLARKRESKPVQNGWHSYNVETSEPYKTDNPQALALRKAYPEGAQVEDPAAKVQALIAAVRWADWPGFFPTPAPLAAEVIAKADIRPGMKVLEPSAGLGDLADLARAAGGEVDVAEAVGALREILTAKGYAAPCDDCLAIQRAPGGIYDRVVMNPPFESGQDVRHVHHCADLLKPGGRLVAIMGKAWQFKDDSRSKYFREWLEEVGAVVEDNDPAAFASAKAFRQTGTQTCTVIIDKPA
jgi:hypothetical protein